MSTLFRRAAAATAALASTAAVIGFAPAQAVETTAEKSRITVHASDHEVTPGEQFVLRGRMAAHGDAVAGAKVKVQTFRNGDWHGLRGAVVRTNSDGRYRVRVILQSGGDRDLRVVGKPSHSGVTLARGYTVVRVLG
jgi:hypothetical protein